MSEKPKPQARSGEDGWAQQRGIVARRTVGRNTGGVAKELRRVNRHALSVKKEIKLRLDLQRRRLLLLRLAPLLYDFTHLAGMFSVEGFLESGAE